MIITCEKCSTKFDLDESVLKKNGSKVRCSMCKHIFKAYPHHGDNLKPQKTEIAIPKETIRDDDLKIDTNLTIDDNIVLDDKIALPHPTPPEPSSKPLTPSLEKDIPFEMDNGLELDLDFSLDDNLELDSPPPEPSSKPLTPSLKKDIPSEMDNGLELDFDFSLEDDLELATPPPQPSKAAKQPVDVDSGLELDFEFSLEDEVALPTPPKSSSKTASQPVDIDGGLELDMDFFTDGESKVDGHKASDQGLEIEIEDGSEFDFDFSGQNESDTKAKKTELDMESISPMDLDFSTDEDIESNDDDFDDDYDDISDHVKGTRQNISDSQVTKKGISLNKPETQSSTLGGHPIRSTIQGSTLLGDRTNLFQENAVFDTKKRSGVRKFILISIVLTIFAIVGYAAITMTGTKISYMSTIKIPYIDKIFSPKPESIKLTPEQNTVSGRFVTNSVSGTLFIITGQVINYSKVRCKEIKIQGTLLATNKSKVKEKTVLCGNIISEDQLKTLDTNAINSILYSSDNSKKFTLEPGQSIPFMVVFSDFPDNLENFTVAVTDFKQVTEN